MTAYLEQVTDQLLHQSILFAKRNAYAPFTTTIRAAWLEAILSLNEAILGYLGHDRPNTSGPLATVDYARDPRLARMRQIARQHRSQGVSLQLYLGLFKHFRRVYLDALSKSATIGTDALLQQVRDFFDESELSIVADWTTTGDNQRLRELQDRTRRLILEKDRYFAIFESLRNPALLLDRHRAIVHGNHAAVELFVDGTEVGDSIYLRSRKTLRSRMTARLGDALKLDEGAEKTLWIDTLAGRRCFDLRLRVLHDAVENIPLGYLLQLYDVTAHRHATETAQRAERQMSRFLATMSHEIRTPLHSVLGAAELLRRGDRNGQESYLDVIQSAGQSLLQTLNNVLDYSKLESGLPEPRPADTDLLAALETLCAIASVGPDAARSSVSLEIARDVPTHVRIDWAMVRQVLTNLVTNALRHDQGGGVKLRVARTQERLRFEVADHGPGLPECEARALFLPFSETSPRHTAEGGAGLGLAISRELVRAMGGQIGFSNTGIGAVVWFDVPCTPVLNDRDDSTPPQTAPHGRRGWRCLLIDDDRIGAIISSHHLQRIGFETDHAGSLAEARKALETSHYDAFVIDYLLPDGKGPDFVRDLRSGNAGACARVVGLTANVEALRASADLGEDFDVILAKPADGATLAQALLPFAAKPVRNSPPGRSNLDGLSGETISAMAKAFITQWESFRIRLRQDTHRKELGDIAHRLAGSSAQLGLHDLEHLLNELERRCETDPSDIADVVNRLDYPVTDWLQWHEANFGCDP
ncbi:hybrid sensor histidine kinase/response regulator [Rhodovulum imhoffii]|uniref:hybrid sensor histidine kinase/response regulator n=1 Tax=Rhodovulum imhoffii TaxID=365340 RepID=UPI001473F827|nr:ATP-binding protein [Rhodovulum imhoffii]